MSSEQPQGNSSLTASATNPVPAQRSNLAEGSALGLGVILAVALFLMVNYLGLRHYSRFDWTSSRLYTLSEKSLQVLDTLEQDIDIVMLLNPESELYGAVDEMASRYAAARPDRVHKRVIDPSRNLLDAQRLVERYGIERDNILVIASEQGNQVIDEFELAEYDYSGAPYGQPPSLKGFKGEQLITSAILELTESRQPKALFTSGHGEAPIDSRGGRGLATAQEILAKDNFQLEEWASMGQSEIPADVDLLVVAGPRSNFLPPELELFDRYLATGGRMLLLLDPAVAESGDFVDLGLESWLQGYGVEARKDVVIDPSREMPFFGPETLFTDSYGTHPIVEPLAQTRTPVLLSLARSVSTASNPPAHLELAELVRTSPAAWGETRLTAEGEPVADEDEVQGALSLGVAVSWQVSDEQAGDLSRTEDALAAETDTSEAVGGEPAEAPSDPTAPAGVADSVDEPALDQGTDGDATEARLVVFGDLDFASDSQVANAGNSALLLNALNWLVEREQLISIEAKTPEETRLNLDRTELWTITLLVLGLMPGLAVAAGVAVFLRRRR